MPNFYRFTAPKSNHIKKEHIIGLDLVRAIAIISVVAGHSSAMLQPLTGVPYIGPVIDVILKNIIPAALLGVELFFVLSGFLIGSILIRTFIETPDFSFVHVRRFWIRRWFRTLPNYWLVFSVVAIFYGYKNSILQKLTFYPFLQNLWYPNPPYLFGEAWSLSIEEWFYLTLPIAIFISYLLFRPVNKKRFLLRVFIGYLLVFLAARFINAFHPINGPDQDAGIRKVVVLRLDSVMYGVLIAYLNYFAPQMLNRMKNRLLAISICGIVVIYYLLASPTINISNAANPTLRFFSDAFLYMLIPLCCCLCLPFFNHLRALPGRRFSATVRHISRISYSMYLVHFSVIFIPLYYAYFINMTSSAITILAYAGYWLLVIGLSSLLYKYYEYPIMQLREKFTKDK